MLGELFSRSPDPESFAAAVRKLGGDFPFDAAEMIGLGEAYFRRHPDSSHQRDAASVLIGYAAVRVCIIERIIRGLAPAGRDFFRSVFEDPSRVGRAAEAVAPAALSADLAAVEAELSAIRRTIEEIPKGPVKERFIGGISHLFNVLYLVRLTEKNHARRSNSSP